MSQRPARVSPDALSGAPPGFLSSWYASAFHSQHAKTASPRSSRVTLGPPPAGPNADSLHVLELRTQLEAKIYRLSLPTTTVADPTRGPPSARLDELEAVHRPSEAEVLSRYLLPLLQHALTGTVDAATEASIVDLCLEELHASLAARAPDLCVLVHGLRVVVDAALGRRAAAEAAPSAHEGDCMSADAREAGAAVPPVPVPAPVLGNAPSGRVGGAVHAGVPSHAAPSHAAGKSAGPSGPTAVAADSHVSSRHAGSTRPSGGESFKSKGSTRHSAESDESAPSPARSPPLHAPEFEEIMVEKRLGATPADGTCHGPLYPVPMYPCTLPPSPPHPCGWHVSDAYRGVGFTHTA